MPTARSHHAGLPRAWVYFLVHGRPPRGPAPLEDDIIGAWLLEGRWLARNRAPEVLGELANLWRAHRAEIEQAAGGKEPWVVMALRSPDEADDGADEQEEPGEQAK